jgi:very-short-patch-repair endonuclease
MSTKRARELRRTMTDAERRLWSGLRDRRLEGLKFRRQVPIGPFYADFVCLDAMLVVEADGSQHHDEEQRWYDHHRTKLLEREGFEVIRFDNAEILRYPSDVLRKVAATARERILIKTQGERSR